MNIQEPDKKPVYEIHESVTITKQHFDWLNWEVLRIGQLARKYSDEGDLLRTEVKRLTKAGDRLAEHLDERDFPFSIEAWNAAKEGKQSE